MQYVPEIAPVVNHLTVFQRSANWIMPRAIRLSSPRNSSMNMRRDPALFEESRKTLHAFRRVEASSAPASAPMRSAKASAWRWSICNVAWPTRPCVPSSRLTMNSPASVFCSSDDYYPALTRDNVTLETAGIEAFVEEGILTKDGRVPLSTSWCSAPVLRARHSRVTC
ncbi:hypothetical protein ACTMU2_16825 [Cupriavidus basilensis]